jgi:hypothetical protein
MKHLLCAGLLLLASTASVRAQIQYLSLNEQTLELPARTFYIGQVLDGRIDRAGVGQREEKSLLGFLEYTEGLDLSPNLVVGLTRFLRAQLPARPTDQSVLLLLRELRVAEYSSSGATAPVGMAFGQGSLGGGPPIVTRHARATIDLYLRTPAGYHFIKTTTDTLRPLGVYAGPSHAHNIARVLQRCLAQYSAADLLAAQQRPAQPLAALARIGHPAQPWELNYPILSPTAHLGPGYYPSFLAFRNNEPVAAPGLRVSVSTYVNLSGDSVRAVIPKLMLDGKERALPDCWGFADGERAYIRHRGQYVALVRQGSDFVFRATLKGSALKPAVHTLDLVAGRTTLFADAGRPAPRTDTARIYVYGPAGSGPGQPVFLNGAPVGTLAENQVLKLAWTDPVHEPRLRLGAVGPELAFMPTFRLPIYVRPARKPAPGQPPLELVPPKVGEFDLKQIRLRAGR